MNAAQLMQNGRTRNAPRPIERRFFYISASAAASPARLDRVFSKLVPPAGLEPTPPAPEAGALSN